MNRRCATGALLALGLALVSPVAAAEPQRSAVALATLDNGAFVGFALLRTGGDAAGGQLGEVSFPRSNSVSRVLVDQDSGAYFGYRLEVEPASSRRKFRVAVKPLGGGIEKELRRRRSCDECPAPTLLAALPRYPAPRLLADGDLFTLDLLVNPKTGERIVDAVQVSSSSITTDAMAAAAARLMEALLAIQRADTFSARGSHAAAAVEYERALAIHPNDAGTRNKLGTVLQRAQRLGPAEKQYAEALKINPSYAEAWNNLGSTQHARGKFREAIKSYQKAVSLKPKFPAALKNMGVAYFALGRFDAGFEAFQAAYRIDPTILEAPGMEVLGGGVSVATQSFYFAKICAGSGQQDAALEFLRKAIAAGFRDFGRIARDPDFRDIVEDPRYKQLLRDTRSAQ